jgi:hypothetical protein
MNKEKTERLKVSVNEHRVLVGQSKKLAALVNKKTEPKSLKPVSEAEQTLNEVNALIDQRIADIMQQYPEGKKQSLFKLRYGCSVDTVKTMELNAALKLLEIDTKHLNLRLLEKT